MGHISCFDTNVPAISLYVILKLSGGKNLPSGGNKLICGGNELTSGGNELTSDGN